MARAAPFPALPQLERPRLELSGPKLARAFERLVSGCEEHGGVERYVEALKLKTQLFRDALDGTRRELTLQALRTLCAFMPTVRRRIGPYLAEHEFGILRARLGVLLEERDDTATTDARVADFCGGFPADRVHRWVRDLAAEILHNRDPERYPLMCRWVWDAGTNTGVLREIWHAADVDHTAIEVPDRYGTFVVLREELAQYLASNGVFRDVLYYVDLLCAQIYAGYISEQGGSYLRTDFSTPEDPVVHVQRLLGLDALDNRGRSRVKAADGEAIVTEPARLN